MNLIKYEFVISNILLQEINLAFWVCAGATLNDYSVSNIISTAL